MKTVYELRALGFPGDAVYCCTCGMPTSKNLFLNTQVEDIESAKEKLEA